jgi:hypothetical protein
MDTGIQGEVYAAGLEIAALLNGKIDDATMARVVDIMTTLEGYAGDTHAREYKMTSYGMVPAE